MSSSSIFHYRHPPTLLLRRNFRVQYRTSNHVRTPYRFSVNPFPKIIQPLSIDRLLFGPEEKLWNLILDKRNGSSRSVVVDEGPEVAVVLLGWLGAKHKHVNKYAQWYNAKGIHSVSFTSSVADVLSCFDLGKKLDERIERLTHELTSWLALAHRDRYLIFHTFSNTGWLT